MKALLTILGIGIILTSCSKYEDGPGFSLVPKSNRLAGEWELDDIDGPDYNNQYLSYLQYSMSFEKNGNFEQKNEAEITTFWGTGSKTETYSTKINGEWEWENNKTELEIGYDQGGKIEYEINKLTSKELILVDENNNVWTFTKI